jgi:TrmH family RNA methyltransferase
MRILTLARDLTRRKAREKSGLFVAEGIRTVEELLASPLRITGALTCDLLDRTPRGAVLAAALHGRDVDVVRVSEREFLSATDTENPQGVLAIAEQPVHTLASAAVPSVVGDLRILVLDGIQDPGNVGTLLRTAAALGAAATVALPGTADIWNAKVVRSAVGMQFRHPTVLCTAEALGTFLRAHGIVLWGADASGTSVDDVRAPAALALAVGNEGAGLTPAVRSACASLVALPMARGAESLNVAVAAGIALFALRQKEHPR